MAVFTDSPLLQVLMHCDETVQDYWLITPDDNSSGREANEPVLDRTNPFDEEDINSDTVPTLMPDSPKGGSYFNFNYENGTNDSIYCNPGWLGGYNIVCEFSFRWLGLPTSVGQPGVPDDRYAALVCCGPWTVFLNSVNYASPHIALMIEQNYMYKSTATLESNTWYDVKVTVIWDEITISINGATETDTSAFSLLDKASPLTIGYDYRYTHPTLPGRGRFFYGDMDEIKIGIAPEPVTFGFIGLLGFLIIRRK